MFFINRTKNHSLLNGTLFLMVTTMVVHIIGALYKIPLTAYIGTVGRGYFSTAYDIYTPIYAISMAGLPIAVSRMVSEKVAQNRYREVKLIFKVVKKIFIVTGIIGTLVLILLAYPYTLFSHRPLAIPSLIAIAPSVFFCCAMSTYRGYYEGLRNMMPTGISQVIEALGKLVFGIIFAKIVWNIGEKQYASTGTVFGKTVDTYQKAVSAIYPYSSAAAIFGVTAGTILGLIFLIIRHKVVGDGITNENLINSPKPPLGKEIAKTLITLAIPIVTSSLVLNITNIIDASTILNRLAFISDKNMDLIRNIYSRPLKTTLDNDVSTYLYGAYGAALDLKNLITTLAMTLGISAIPALSGAWAVKNKQSIKNTIEIVLRAVMLMALPLGFVMAVLAEPIMTLMYIGTNADNSISISAHIVTIYGFAAALLAVSSPITNMLQAIGLSDVPIKSLIIGAIVKILCNYLLVGNPNININGAPIGTILCYIIIVAMNLYELLKETNVKISISSVLIKPLICSALSCVSAWTSYGLLNKLFINIGNVNSRLSGSTLALLISFLISMLIYSLSLFLLKAVSKSDILMFPRGEKIAKTLEKYKLIS